MSPNLNCTQITNRYFFHNQINSKGMSTHYNLSHKKYSIPLIETPWLIRCLLLICIIQNVQYSIVLHYKQLKHVTSPNQNKDLGGLDPGVMICTTLGFLLQQIVSVILIKPINIPDPLLCLCLCFVLL